MAPKLKTAIFMKVGIILNCINTMNRHRYILQVNCAISKAGYKMFLFRGIIFLNKWNTACTAGYAGWLV